MNPMPIMVKCSACPFVAHPQVMQAHIDYLHDGDATAAVATKDEYIAWQGFVMKVVPELDEFD